MLNYEEVIEDCTKALKETALGKSEPDILNVKVKPLLLKRADAYQKIGEYKRALGDIQQIMALDKDDSNELVALAQNIVKQQQNEVEKQNLASTSAVAEVLQNSLKWETSWEIKNGAMTAEEDASMWQSCNLAISHLLERLSHSNILQIFFKTNGVSILLPSLMRLISINENTEVEKWKWNCVQVLRLASSSPVGAMEIVNFLLTSSELQHFFSNLTHGENNALVLDWLNKLLIQYSPKKMESSESTSKLYDETTANRIHLMSLSWYLTNIKSDSHLEVRRVTVYGLLGLLKDINDDIQIILTLLESGIFIEFALLASDQDEKLSAVAPALFSCLFDSIKRGDNNELSKAKNICRKIYHTIENKEGPNSENMALQFLTAIYESGTPEIATFILTEDAVLPSIMETIELESENVQKKMLDLLCQSCIDKNVRKHIANNCIDYLKKLQRHHDDDMKGLAVLTMLKLGFSADDPTSGEISQQKHIDSYRMLSEWLKKTTPEKFKVYSIEGLALLSLLCGEAKEEISKDADLLDSMKKIVQEDSRAQNYGITTVLDNVTSYKEKLTEEQEQMMKLQQLANKGLEAGKVKEDPFSSDDKVRARNFEIVKAGIVPILVHLSKLVGNHSDMAEKLGHILLSLATDERNRGAIVQQGGVKAMFSLYQKITNVKAKERVIQAIAKIGITMDPSVAFKGQNVFECVKPLLELCRSQQELQQFEALLALTNIASMDDHVRKLIYNLKGFKLFETLQLADNPRIRCAATEAICNMLFLSEVFEDYLQSKSSSRFRIFIAIGGDVEDFSSCRAATGALAILSQHPKICELLIQEKNMVPLLEDILAPQLKEEIHHRGVECVKNMTSIKDIAQKLHKSSKIPELLRQLVTAKIATSQSSNPTVKIIVESAVRALKNIDMFSKS